MAFRSPVPAYEVYTRNSVVKHYLKQMYNKYGISDYALQTSIDWNINPLEIFPVKTKSLENSMNMNTLESIDELVLYQYNRLEYEIENNPIIEFDFPEEPTVENNPIQDNMIENKDEYSYLYLVKEEKPVKSYKIFQGFIEDGVHGLCISRMHPTHLTNSYGLNSNNIIWLCHTDGKNNVDPKDLSKLVDRINSFILENGNSVILIDGLEYLISHNGLKKVLSSLNDLHNQIRRETMFILPIHPKALRKEDLCLLEESICR